MNVWIDSIFIQPFICKPFSVSDISMFNLIFIGGFQYFRERVSEWWADTPGKLICMRFLHVEFFKIV